MNHLPQPTFKLLLVSFLILSSLAVTAQARIDLKRDTISKSAANNAHGRYRSDMAGGNKKITNYVKFNVDQLKDIMDRCKAYKVDTVFFMIATLHNNDIAHYASHHPGLTNQQRSDLIGRQILLIRVPRAAFPEAAMNQSSSIRKDNPLLLSLLSYGWTLLDKPYGANIAEEDVYFDIGVICPPPGSCN